MNGILCHVTWNNHSSTFLNFLSSLHGKDKFCNATIVCHGKYYPVHQIVLSSCSEYFQEIFEHTKCKHPFIIIKDVKPTEFEALLSYMYKGMVNVAEEKLPLFIKAAEGLKVKGLAAPDDPPKQLADYESNKRNDAKFGSPPPAKRKKLSESPKENRAKTINSQSLDLINKKQACSVKTSVFSNVGGGNATNLPEEVTHPVRKDDLLQQELSEHVEDYQCLDVNDASACLTETVVADDNNLTLTEQCGQKKVYKTEQLSPVEKHSVPIDIPGASSSVALQRESFPSSSLSVKQPSHESPNFKNQSFHNSPDHKAGVSTAMSSSSYTSVSGSPSHASSTTISKEISRKLEYLSPGKNRMDPSSVSPLNPMVRLNPIVVQEYTTTATDGNNRSEDSTMDSDNYSMGDSEASEQTSREDGKSRDSMDDVKSFTGSRRESMDSMSEDIRQDSPVFIEPRSCRKDKGDSSNFEADKTLQIYNLNHIPLNNVFAYRVFRNVNLFIEYLLKDTKREDAFAKSLTSIFKFYISYRRICDTIMNTFDERTSEDQTVWISKLANLDPPLFGKHLQYDSAKGDVLFSNDVIPALMVIWQFRDLISKHCLVKDLKPGLTSTPRQKFIKGIQQNSRLFRKEKLFIFKSHLRTFYRYSLSDKNLEFM